MSTKRVLCKYFKHGACMKGDVCQFSHDWRDQENNVCTFYQRGLCSYGSRCRYEHVKIKHTESIPSVANSVSGGRVNVANTTSSGCEEDFNNAQEQPSGPPSTSAWLLPSTNELFASETGTTGVGSRHDPGEMPLCALAAAGRCTLGDSCPHLHGDLCETCGKLCLHPFRSEEREEHQRQCARTQKRLEALRDSQDIECSVCLERVLSKPTVAERKFGLLSGCDHPFCISCIRGWRSGVHAPGMDVEGVVRTCPVCRVMSYYVIPSVTWYCRPEEKQEIIDGYKAKLSEIDCRNFNFGNGTCSFGTSCFYKHAFRDGTREQITLRHLNAADGSTVIAKDVRLSEFLSGSIARR